MHSFSAWSKFVFFYFGFNQSLCVYVDRYLLRRKLINKTWTCCRLVYWNWLMLSNVWLITSHLHPPCGSATPKQFLIVSSHLLEKKHWSDAKRMLSGERHFQNDWLPSLEKFDETVIPSNPSLIFGCEVHAASGPPPEGREFSHYNLSLAEESR